jgi:hypothetical protein
MQFFGDPVRIARQGRPFSMPRTYRASKRDRKADTTGEREGSRYRAAALLFQVQNLQLQIIGFLRRCGCCSLQSTHAAILSGRKGRSSNGNYKIEDRSG